MKINIKPWILQALVLTALYILLSNAKSAEPNPFTPGAVINVSMIVPLIAGILFGWRVGLISGAVGTLINAFITGSSFEFLSIISHALIGFLAGISRKKIPWYLLSILLVIGNAINICLFFLYGLMPVIRPNYWLGVLYEVFIGILATIVIITIYKKVFESIDKKEYIKKPSISELSTNPKIWIIMSVIFITLSAVFILLFYFRTIFIVFIIAIALILFVENILNDFYRKIEKYKLPRWKSRIYGYSLLIFWLFTIYILIGGSVTQLISVVNTDVKAATAKYYEMLDPYIPVIMGEKIFNTATLKLAESYIFKTLKELLSVVTSVIINGILIIPLMFYMYFRQSKKIGRKIFRLLPKKFREGAMKSSREISQQMRHFLTAKTTESVVIGGICCLGFYIAGLKGWLFLGMLAGLLNIIPFLGPLIGAIPPLLIALLDGPQVVLYVLITVIIAQLLDNLYLIPFMISAKVKIDSLLGIVLILVGAELAGPLGMILALPIYLVYKITLREMYLELARIYK